MFRYCCLLSGSPTFTEKGATEAAEAVVMKAAHRIEVSSECVGVSMV
jgi:hypothetical protein